MAAERFFLIIVPAPAGHPADLPAIAGASTANDDNLVIFDTDADAELWLAFDLRGITMQIMFCTSNLIGAVLIRTVTWSKWSHVASALSQLEKPYDLKSLVGLLIHRDWASDSQWWCSELAAWLWKDNGYSLFRDEAMNRITPQHLWMLNYPIVEEK